MFTSARLADRIPATYSVRIGPAFQNTSPICVAMPTGPATGGGAVGSVATELDRARRGRRGSGPSASDRLLRPRRAMAVRRSSSWSPRRSSPRTAVRRSTMPRAPWSASICRPGAQRDRDTSRRVAVGAIDRQRRPSARRCARRPSSERLGPSKNWKRSPSIATMASPACEPGRGGRRIRAGPRRTGRRRRRREPGDGGEDHERQQRGSSRRRRRGSPALSGRRCAENERGSSASSPSSPSSFTKPPIGSQLSV